MPVQRPLPSRAVMATGSLRDEIALSAAQLARWSGRRWLVAAAAAALAALLLGIPTGIVATSFYHRMTPAVWWDYLFWASSLLLLGLLAATYVRAGGGSKPAHADPTKRTFGGGVVSLFAIGCPICNKLVVALLGVSGALNYFGPAQPLLGSLAVALLLTALAARLRGEAACPSPARDRPADPRAG